MVLYLILKSCDLLVTVLTDYLLFLETLGRLREPRGQRLVLRGQVLQLSLMKLYEIGHLTRVGLRGGG